MGFQTFSLPPQLGASVVSGKRDPMALIKDAAPLLSEETRRAPAQPLSQLEAATAQDETCVWQRVSFQKRDITFKRTVGSVFVWPQLLQLRLLGIAGLYRNADLKKTDKPLSKTVSFDADLQSE